MPKFEVNWTGRYHYTGTATVEADSPEEAIDKLIEQSRSGEFSLEGEGEFADFDFDPYEAEEVKEMEKYAQKTTLPDEAKTASGEILCPKCGAKCSKHGDTIICPNCGTEPFAKKVEED